MIDKIYILLPVHNRRHITQAFIECLNKQKYQNYHLVLIDDGSTDGTSAMVGEVIKSLTVIRGDGSGWWAGSLQQGFNWLGSQHLPLDTIILIINDDTYIGPEFLEQAVLSLQKTGPRTLLGAQAHNSNNNEIQNPGIHVDWRRMTFEKTSDQEKINCLSTRGLFLRLSDFLEIGGFYPKLLPHYLSDFEFTIRAYSKGLKLRTEPCLKIFINEKTTGYHTFEEGSFWEFQKGLFSKKSMINPLAWFVFVAIACPRPWKFSCWLRVFSRTVKLEARQIMLRLQRSFGR